MKHLILCILFLFITSMQAWGAPNVGINGGGCVYYSIQDAVNASSSGDTIQVSAGEYTENVVISSKDITISGDYASDCTTTGGGTTTVDGDGNDSVFSISGSTVTLQELQITGGDASNGGGLRIVSASQVTLENTDVYENTAVYGGGAYVAIGTQLTLNQSTIHNNTATGNGGGVKVWGTLTANDTDSDIFYNSAPNGGGLSVPGGIVNLIAADMYQNQATDAAGKGGAIHVYDSGVITLTNTCLIGWLNQAYDGAGIYADASTVTTEGYRAIFRQNIASHYGGSIYLSNSSVLTLNNADVGQSGSSLANEAVQGAGIYMDNSTVNFTGSNVINNTASLGGGIYVYSGELNFINNNTIEYNSASYGGALYQYGGSINFNGSWTFENNSASINGGALLITGDGVTSFYAEGENSLSNNQAGSNGGAVFLYNTSTVKLHATYGYDLNVLDNHADINGGAFYADQGGYFDNYGQLIIDGNNASGNGGAFYLTNGSRVWFDDYISTVPKIQSNWAQNGGAVYVVDSPSVQCDGAEFGETAAGNYTTNGSGGAIYLSNSTLDADNCKFYNNRATENGGAIAAYGSTLDFYATYNTGSLTPMVMSKTGSYSLPIVPMSTAVDPLAGEASSLNNNVADSDSNSTGNGGAIYTSDSSLEITQTYLHHNSSVRGGAIFQEGASASAEVSNSLIHHNTVTAAYGAGIRSENGEFSIMHTTITDNTGGAGFSIYSTSGSAYNNIVWGNSMNGFSGIPTDYGCNIDDGENAGINVDPLFVSPGSGEDYHLQEDSPARNTCGTAGFIEDLESQSRPNETNYDMGAYEFYLPEYVVASVVSPIGGGTVTGAGTYEKYSTVILNETAASGYVFLHWSIGGQIVSTSDSYSTTVTGNLTVQATFSAEQSEYTVTSAAATDHGTVTGGGTYSHGSEVTITAYPDSGYRFSHWVETWDGFEGSIVVSTDEEYTFSADRDRNLTAVFRPILNPGVLMLLLDD